MRVEKTAGGVAVMRALEQHARPRLFDDPLAAGLLTGWSAVMVAHAPLRRLFLRLLERAGPGFYGAVVCRTRVIDDECRAALADGVEQVVILGAGFDTRAHRLPEMASVPVREFDLPVVQAAKKARLPDGVTYLPVDLTEPDPLPVAGPGRTLLLCEAVTMYLPEEAVRRFFAYAQSLAPGSRVIVTYLPRGVDGHRWSKRLRWRSSFHPAELAERLGAHGLRLLRDIGAEQHHEMLRALGREMAVFPGERIAVAERV